jgi:hypothetical protein
MAHIDQWTAESHSDICGAADPGVRQTEPRQTGDIVNRLFAQGDLKPFLSLRLSMERAIRAQCSEHVIMQVYDAIYAPVKRATAQVHNAVEAALGEAFGINPDSSLRSQHARALGALRTLLESDAKERALQDALVDSGLLRLNCKVVQEVTMSATKDYRGMRMDLVLDSNTDEPSQIVELKRGSHLLLARRGKPTERLSLELRKAVEQLKTYGDRVESDAATTLDLEERLGIRLDKPELRLIAGRRLPDAHGYHLLSRVEPDANDSGLQLQIYTWDGFLAELERIAD